jgi:hypothetical protein
MAALVLCLITTGCSLAPIHKPAADFSDATTIVVDNSEDAYRAAIKLRHDEQVDAAVYAYDKNPHWSPYKDMQPLLTPEQLDARIIVLDGLKAYAASLVELTGKPTDNPALTAAAAAVGTNLQTLNQTVATGLSTAVPNAPVISTVAANGISTAVLALGDYLISRKVKNSLPKVIQQMDPNIKILCDLLNKDITILRRQAKDDYERLAQDQDAFIRHAGSELDPIQHRKEVGKLLDIAAQQQANDDLLAKLQDALLDLASTHQALVTAVQTKDAATFRQKVAELQAAGRDLGTYYKSLPTTN